MPIDTLLLLLALALFSKAALPVALAQPIAVSMSPAEPLQFCSPGSCTLTATATDPGFASGTGFNDNVYAVLRQADGQLLLGGRLFSYGNTARTPLARLVPDGTFDTGFVPSGIPAGAK